MYTYDSICDNAQIKSISYPPPNTTLTLTHPLSHRSFNPPLACFKLSIKKLHSLKRRQNWFIHVKIVVSQNCPHRSESFAVIIVTFFFFFLHIIFIFSLLLLVLAIRKTVSLSLSFARTNTHILPPSHSSLLSPYTEKRRHYKKRDVHIPIHPQFSNFPFTQTRA